MHKLLRDDSSTIAFVKAVEKHPCLWNHTLKEYNRKEATDPAWKTISEQFYMSEQNCRDRWKNIRCCFVRAQKNGKRPYYLEEHMGFLRPYTKSKYSNSDGLSLADDYDQANSLDSTIENPEVIEYTEEGDDDPLEEDDNFQLSPTPQSEERERRSLKRKFIIPNKFKHDGSDCDRFEGASNSNDNSNENCRLVTKIVTNSEEVDPDLMFFKSLLPDIKELPVKQKRVFKRKVMSLLEELLDGN